MQIQIFDTITQEYLQATQHWFNQVESAGMHLMVILVLIQFTLKISKNILSGEGNLTGMMINTIKNLIVISILYYLITNAGTLLPELFNSFTQLGIAGSTITAIDPSSVVSEGLSIASGIIQSFNAWGVLSNIAFAIFGTFCCILIVICYGLIAADLMITLIESYFLVAVSALFIAFGSTSYTLPMAREYLGMTIGVGIKLMMLYVMIAVGVAIGQDWAAMINQASQHDDWTTCLGIAVGALVYYLIVKHVPGRIASAASQAFAISHMNDAKESTVAAISSMAAAGTYLTTMGKALAGNGGGVGEVLNTSFGHSGSGMDMAMSSGVASSEGGSLSSAMLTHFGGSGDTGSMIDEATTNSSPVIHLSGPNGQGDFFNNNNKEN
jgi:type IV secretion system protein TrbL